MQKNNAYIGYRICLGRASTFNRALFLAPSAASYITGAVIPVDDGTATTL